MPELSAARHVKWKKIAVGAKRSKEEFPWFWGWDETNASLAVDYGASISDVRCRRQLDGNRWNDLHYTRSPKKLPGLVSREA